MLKISREVDLALLLLTDLSSRERVVSLKEWAEKRGLPYRYLSKIAVKLKKKGVLASKEGRDGGYWLKKKSEEVKVREVVEILEGPVMATKCVGQSKCECEEICSHKGFMKKLSKIVEEKLEEVSIKDLC